MPENNQILASYVPPSIIRHLTADTSSLDEPRWERYRAAVLFADISGFTNLTEQLARHGMVGIEEVSNLLNGYFSKIIDLVIEEGGEVVKFAGDALLALWVETESEPLETMAMRATQCAQRAQAALKNYETPVEDHRLSMRIGVDVGDVFSVHIGGMFKRWEFIVAGEPIQHASRAETHAQPGQVVVAPSAWELIYETYDGELIEGGYIRLDEIKRYIPAKPAPVPELSEETVNLLSSYIPKAVLTRLQAGYTSWLAELRYVSVLFISLPEMDHTLPIARAQDVMRSLQEAIYHYEGSINKLSVDEKGVTMVAAFGLPPISHEDDARRAVQAGLELRDRMKTLGIHTSIGITSGRVFCGLVGNEKRREYTMIGSTMNLAARLMTAAHGNIYCDIHTAHEAEAGIEFEVIPPVHVKGRDEPIPVYVPRRKRTGPSDLQSEMVGRMLERIIIEERLNALMADESSAFIIEGDAGIGKTKLASYLMREAIGLAEILQGAADAVEASSPYHAWRDVFWAYFNLEESHDLSARQEMVLEKLKQVREIENPADLAPLLNDVIPLDLPESELTSQMSGQVRAENTRELLLVLLEFALSQNQRIVIILEDTQWMDSASWALTQLVFQRIQPVLLVLVTRPLRSENTAEEYLWILNHPKTTHILLENLSPQETIQLACHKLGVRSLPDAVATLIRDRAEGHPFYTEELAYALRDSGMIETADGECRIAPGIDLTSITVPETVQGIITSRIDRLQPEHQLALKVASVLGRVFAFRVLRAIHPIESDKPRLLEYLSTLEKLDLTPQEKPEPDLSYIFKHKITQEVAYNLMLFTQRQTLHRLAAQWYESAHPADQEAYYPLLAHHWVQADDKPKAVTYLEKAGTQALQTGAFQEAIYFIKQAIEIGSSDKILKATESGVPHALRRARWHRQLAQAEMSLGHIQQARMELEACLGLLEFHVPDNTVVFAAILLGQVVEMLLRTFAKAKLRYHNTRHDERLLEAGRALSLLSEVYFYLNDTVATLYGTFGSLNVIERRHEPEVPALAQACANIAVAAGFIQLFALSDLYAKRALDVARRLEKLDVPTSAFTRLLIGLYRGGKGDWAGSDEIMSEALELFDNIGDFHRLGDILELMALNHYHRGNYAEAIELLHRLQRIATRIDNRQHMAWGYYEEGKVLTRLGKAREALPLVEQAIPLQVGNIDIVGEIDSYAALTLTHLHLHHLTEARTYAETVRAIIDRTGSPTNYSSYEGYGCVANTYLRLWEEDKDNPNCPYKVHAAEGIKHSASFAQTFPFGTARTSLLRGIYERLDGNLSKAKKHLQKAIQSADQYSMPLENGMACYQLGLCTSGDERQGYFRRATEIFEQINAQFELEKIRRQP